MAGLDWIKVDANLRHHRKAVELCILLQDPLAWAHLIILWSWASQNQHDGFIPGGAARIVVAHVVAYAYATRTDAEKWVEAAIKSRWLDERDSGLYIHDWHHHQGAHIEKAGKERERLKTFRSDRTRTKPVRNADASRTVHVEKRVTNKRDLADASLPQPETLSLLPEEPKKPAQRTVLSNLLVRLFKEIHGGDYAFEGAKDALAIGRLLKHEPTEADLERRYRAHCAASKPQFHGIAAFVAAWNAYAGHGVTSGAPKDLRKGTVRAEDQHHDPQFGGKDVPF